MAENNEQNIDNEEGLDGGLTKSTSAPVVNLVDSEDGLVYYLRKNRFLKVKCGLDIDEIEGVGRIDFKRRLPQFDTSFAKAYAVNNKVLGGAELYAVLPAKNYPFRLAEINKLEGKQIAGMVNLVAASVIPVSIQEGRSFVLVFEVPKGISLNEYIKQNGAANFELVARNVVPVIGSVIMQLSNMSVVHGKINISNLYIDNSGVITLGECLSEPCGYSQATIYETMSRATAMRIGKGSGTSAVDYYALGVSVGILLRGRDPTENLNEDAVLDIKFEKGTYKIVTENLEIPPHILDLLRGVLTERRLDVWDATKLEQWVRGRRFNLLPPADSNEVGRPLVFKGKKYNSRRYLVHALYQNWDEAKKFVHQDNIIRWIDRNSKEQDLVERLQMASNRYGKDKDLPGFDKEDEVLAQHILLLDPTGPIRLKNFSANIDGIGLCLVDGFASGKRNLVDAIEHLILRNFSTFISGNGGPENQYVHDTLFALKKCADLIRKRDLGFGIERCLYELNPTLSCQSPMVIENLCFNKNELIKVLDSNDKIGGQILDKHMASFLSERMEIVVKIFIPQLTRFPEFSNNIFIQVLSLLSLAQQTSNVGPLPKLCNKIYNGLKNVVEDFHSKSIRTELENSLTKVVQKGILGNVLRIITDTKYLVRDRVGFKKAVSVYRRNAIQIVKLSNSKAVNNIGYRYGLQIAVMISFFVATLEIIVLMIKAF